VVRRTDNHGVDIFAGQNLVVVARGKDIVAPDLLAVRQPSVVAIGHGHQLDTGNLDRNLRVSLSLPACANQRYLNVVVG
jgi:hypothetical protein